MPTEPYTPAELESAARAAMEEISRFRPPGPLSTNVARAVLDAVAPLIATRERTRVAGEIAQDIERGPLVDDGRHPAAARERQINAAVARSHATPQEEQHG